MFIISNPYLTDDEIRNIMDYSIWQNNERNGDFSQLKYAILGKERSYYNPANTNLLVFYI